MAPALVVAGMLVALVVGQAGSAFGGDAAAAGKYKQPGCKKFKKAKKNASSKAKKRKAKAKLKQCKANAKVYKLVKNSRFTGTRGDGLAIDTIYCANGKVQDDVETFGTVYKKGWRVESATVKKGGKKIKAILATKISGGEFVQAVARSGDQWQIGIASFDEGSDFGDVEKTKAKQECSEL